MTDRDSLEARVRALEERVELLLRERALPQLPETADPALPGGVEEAPTVGSARKVAVVANQHGDDRGDDFWVLRGVQKRHPEGAVVFAGSVSPEGDAPVHWQYGSTYEDLASRDWGESAGVLDALGNPVRLQLLQLVLAGVSETGELAAQEALGTTGQLHHHLRVLRSAGWLASRQRGHYEIPRSRVVPLLAVLLAVQPT